MGALQYIFLRQSDFAESGAGSNNLSVDSSQTHSLRGILGGQAYWQHPTAAGLLIPDLHAQWIHEFLDTHSTVLVNVAPAVTVPGLDPGRDFALLGVGITAARSERVRWYFAYDVQVNDRQVFHIGAGVLEWTW
ncbi:MAG: hypothetical protein KatS3mg110_3261 [Pirellulaceae bacterium]|nr:MAG: hypothetical protein KatS3mg110_3261 [Pirellulaceae bacterium]